MKKTILSLLSMLALVVVVTSCKSDDVSSESIFKTEEQPKNEFDTWLYKNFTQPYNIEFRYRYQDSETDNYYNVVPADPEKAKALAILVKELWIGAYESVFGPEFIKQYGPKVYQLLGSPEFSSNESIVLGYAESGVKITLFRVNEIDVDNIFVNTTDAFRDHYELPMDLNHWFFHTMHHEFCHILTQTKDYPTDFREISAGHYHTSDWINVKDADAPKEGFVTGYASGEYNEDFAEVFSTYVTSTDKVWNQILNASRIVTGSTTKLDKDGNPVYKLDADGKRIIKDYLYDQDGNRLVQLIDGKLYYAYEYEVETIDTYDDTYYNMIIQKLDMVKDYMKDSWGISLDDLRNEVLRRTENVYNLDLKTLK